ncbi:ABC transporter ATP-binding protein [Shewanella marina]|uniref:ABC transporter ATP-binding protein n=1 Tax=Shewanella marina TaxID=487319 RepID=UPI00046E5BAA|nr:ABC transporter ATP-binding protein [Shewanella marina]
MSQSVVPAINIAQLRLAFNDDELIFDNFNCMLEAGQFTCLLGRSGCGKSTLVKLLADLIEPQFWQGQVATSDGLPLQGRVAYMAQQDLLLPWLNVLDNACLMLRFGQFSAKQRQRLITQAKQLLIEVGLADNLMSMPSTLSGGMRQRVALVRTLLQEHPVVLMDEPFSALDAVSRHQLQTLAARLLRGKTVLFISHDPQEVLRLADKLYLLNNASQLQALPIPHSQVPRIIDAELARYQQQILDSMENCHV